MQVEEFSMEIPRGSLDPHLECLNAACDQTDDVGVSGLHTTDFQQALAATGDPRQVPETEIKIAGLSGRWPGTVPPPYLLNGIATTASASLAEQISIYKEEQLLVHPGGDDMDLGAANPKAISVNHENFLQRVGKDLKDSVANVGNFFRDLLSGAEYRYVDEVGEVQTARRKGVLGNIVEFFKDAASGLSLGYYRPDGEPEPAGPLKRLRFLFKKLLGEGVIDDLVFGVPSSAVNLMDDVALGLWNLIEVVPDASIGNLPEGQRIVTALFDDGQVLIDYLTDCLPTSEAWMRVHALRLDKGTFMPPVIYNIKLPERFSLDPRWRAVRNTPFRKTIETIGSLLADVWLGKLTSHAVRTSKRRS
jgi:hypothetical protein